MGEIKTESTPSISGRDKAAEVESDVVQEKSEATEIVDETADLSDESEKETSDSDDDTLELEVKKDEGEKDESEENKPKQKNGFKKRIDKLNARVKAKEDEANYWRNEAMKYTSKDSKKEEAVETKAETERAKPVSENFETYDDYVEALTEWKAEEKLRARDEKANQESLKAKVNERVKTHNQRVDAYREKNPDFNDALSEFFEANGTDFNLSMAVEELITESEFGPAILHELIKNPDDFKQLNQTGAMAAARKIGKIEAMIEARNKSETKTEKKLETKTTTSAPPPISTVKAKGGMTVKDPNKMSQREYEEWRMSKQA